MTPFSECGIAVHLEICSIDEVTLVVEMVVAGGMNGGEFLQAPPTAKTLHGPLSSPKRLLRIFSAQAAIVVPVDPAECFPLDLARGFPRPEAVNGLGFE